MLVIGKVFTAHDRRDDFHLLFPQRLPCAGKDGFGGGAVILNGRVAGYDLDLTVGTVGLAQPLGKLFDAGSEFFSCRLRDAAHRAFQGDAFRNDVHRRAARKDADGENRGFLRGNVVGDQTLQRQHQVGTDFDGVDGLIGHRTVPAAPFDLDDELVCRGHHRADGHGNPASFQRLPDMAADDVIDVCEGTIGNHVERSAGEFFFAGLENEAIAAGQFVFHGLQGAGDAQHDGGVGIVPAGVADAGIDRSVGLAAFVRDGQGVDVGPDGDFLARSAALNFGEDAGFASDLMGNAHATQQALNFLLCFVLHATQFRMLAEMPPVFTEDGFLLFDDGL